MAEILFGIDFGACNLKCARVGAKKISPIRLTAKDDGTYHAPNAIFYSRNRDGSLEKIIGQAALNKGVFDSANLVVGLKRKLEQKNWRQFIPTLNREVTAAEVVEDIMQKIFDTATKNFTADDIARAVVTVPIIFTKHQRQLIRSAAQKAGFRVERTVNEAFAAIFAAENLSDSLNVVFDFGGSTLDVSIIKISGNEVGELAAAGIRLGGLDIDRDILEKILRPKFAEIIDSARPDSENINFRLDFARRLKEAVYSADIDDEICAGEISAKPDFDKIFLSRAEIDGMLEREGYGEKISALLDDLFDDLAQGDDCFDKTDVTKIWAIGGSMHISYFRELLENYFGAEIFDANDYDFEDVEDFVRGLEDKYLVVAGGAANFLQQSDAVNATNVVPYRIFYRTGKNLRRGLERNMPARFETLFLPLEISDLRTDDWQIDFYQNFSDEANVDDAAYLAGIKLNSALYKTERPLMALKMTHDGRLRVRISERRIIDGEPDTVLIEQHFLILED